eukprot:5741859-Amphidinium_carterae.1
MAETGGSGLERVFQAAVRQSVQEHNEDPSIDVEREPKVQKLPESDYCFGGPALAPASSSGAAGSSDMMVTPPVVPRRER